MNLFAKRLSSLSFVIATSLSLPVLAQAMDGFVSPAFTYDGGSGFTSKSRYGLQFGRLNKNVELDLTIGQNQDYGAILRIYNHFSLLNESSATGISVGLGAGAYATTGDAALTDAVIQPFIRGLFDFGMGMGLAVDGGMSFIARRTDKSGDVVESASMRKGFFVGATLMLTSRWLE